MDVEHALDGLQLRINTAKHLSGISDILSSDDFVYKIQAISKVKAEYFATEGSDVELGKKVQELCAEARSMLY
jgi:hypothetical protein